MKKLAPYPNIERITSPYLTKYEKAFILGKRASKRSKVSQVQELLEHQHQKMQQQLERIRFEAISKASVVSTPCQNAQV